MRILPILLLCLLLATDTHAQEDDSYTRLAQQATTYYRNQDFKRAAQTLESAIALKGKNAGYTEVFNAACSWAMAGDADNAFKHLNYLAAAVMSDPQEYLYKQNQDPLFYMFDDDLAPLHADKRWNEMIGRLQKRRKPIVNMLDSIYLEDQLGRKQIDKVEKQYGRQSEEMKALWNDINVKDSINLIRVKAIIDSFGWLGEDSIGQRGNNTLFLVIQHSDQQTQEHYLPIMREAVKDKRASAAALALLEDRVALGRGGRQLYGSQIGSTPDGVYYVLPLEDPDNVDARRLSMGLPSLKSYVRNWDMQWDVEAYKKQLPELEKMQEKRKGN